MKDENIDVNDRQNAMKLQQISVQIRQLSAYLKHHVFTKSLEENPTKYNKYLVGEPVKSLELFGPSNDYEGGFFPILCKIDRCPLDTVINITV